MTAADLRTRLAAGESVLMPGVWDAITAKLAAEAGFATVFLSGYAVSGTLLGVPDFGLLTQTEMAEVARRVCRAVPGVNVVVDADTGYGNPLNTIRTVELWSHACASGEFLPDTGLDVGQRFQSLVGRWRAVAGDENGTGAHGLFTVSEPAPTRHRADPLTELERCQAPAAVKRTPLVIPACAGMTKFQPSRRNAGNKITSRMLGESVSSIIKRSMTMPQPPVGGMPYSSARMKSAS